MIIGLVLNSLAILILLYFGFIYLFRKEFMPYHEAAVERSWDEVEKPFQILILALMRAVSGGYLALAFIVASLQYFYIQSRLPWLPVVMALVGIIGASPSIYATYCVRKYTKGNPPFGLAVAVMLLIVLGSLFNYAA